MNKIEIEIPVGKEVDWEASAKQKQIVLKDKRLTYKDVCEKLFTSKLWYLNSFGTILHTNSSGNDIQDANNASTQHQLECILAKNKLANVARYLNGDWKHSSFDKGLVIGYNPALDHLLIVKIEHYTDLSNVVFKSRKLAKQAIEILGEETVKLALEPLY